MEGGARKGALKKACLVFYLASMPWLVGSHTYGKNNRKNKHTNPSNLNNLRSCTVNLQDLASHNNNISELNKLCGDGSKLAVYKCKSKRCEIKNIFKAKDKVVSTSSKRIFNCIVPPGSVYIDCHSSNLIYLLTCSRCSLQYVGETVQKLNERLNWHKSGFRNPKKYGYCRILSDHFHKGVCRNASFTVQILEKLEGNGRTKRNAMDASITAIRKRKEKEWMLKMRTVFPYGLNDRLGDDFVKEDTHILVGTKFPALPRKHDRMSRGLAHKFNRSLSPNEFISKFKYHLQNKLPETPNFSRTQLLSMKKSNLKKTVALLNDNLNNTNNSVYSQWYLMAMDIIDSKIFKPPPVIKKKTPPKNICKIFFDNKAVELINLSRIFNDPVVKGAIPDLPSVFDTPTIVYNLSNSIGSHIFNYNKFVNTLDINSFINDETILPCECEGSPFIDKDHNHIITGNLKIIHNNKLRKLFSKGPKYRENKSFSFEKAKSNIIAGLNTCIESWCDKHGTTTSAFSEWKQQVLTKVDERIQHLSKQSTTTSNKQVLKDKNIIKDLQTLHNKFVIVPIDKASGNVAFICQRHYANVLIKELGLENTDNTSPTYMKVSKPINNIVSANKTFLKNKFNLEVSECNHRLPNIYWTPKLHKNPSKARFIIAAPKCSVKPLSKAVTAALKLMYKQVENYNYKSHY